jgi:ferredoxin
MRPLSLVVDRYFNAARTVKFWRSNGSMQCHGDRPQLPVLSPAVGNAMCESIVAKTFGPNDDSQSVVVDPMANTEAAILEAAENCPVSAIFVEDAGTGERLFP